MTTRAERRAKLLSIDIGWIIASLVIALAIVAPIFSIIDLGFVLLNILVVFTFLVYLKWFVFLKQSPIIIGIWPKAVVFFFNIFYFLFLIAFLQDMGDRVSSGMMSEFSSQEINEMEDGISSFRYQYFTREVRFFIFGNLMLVVLLTFRILHYLYRNLYKLNRK